MAAPSLPSLSLSGKLAVITGGAGGLGLSIGEGLIRSGASVAIVDLNESLAQKAASHLTVLSESVFGDRSDKPTSTAHKCDVSSHESVQQSIDSVLAAHPPRPLGIDILVTAAGFTENFPAEDYPVDKIRRLWGVNVDGTYFWAAAVARDRRRRLAALAAGSSPVEAELASSGLGSTVGPSPFELSADRPGCSIIMIGSMSGAIVNVPQPQAPYNASKAAVRHLAASMAVEWADAGIRVNCISPGYMATELTKTILEKDPALHRIWLSRIPAGRLGRPEDLQGMVVFLGSDASAYVTGGEFRVDGGYTVV